MSEKEANNAGSQRSASLCLFCNNPSTAVCVYCHAPRCEEHRPGFPNVVPFGHDPTICSRCYWDERGLRGQLFAIVLTVFLGFGALLAGGPIPALIMLVVGAIFWGLGKGLRKMGPDPVREAPVAVSGEPAPSDAARVEDSRVIDAMEFTGWPGAVLVLVVAILAEVYLLLAEPETGPNINPSYLEDSVRQVLVPMACMFHILFNLIATIIAVSRRRFDKRTAFRAASMLVSLAYIGIVVLVYS